MLTADEESWTIHVVLPESSSTVPPLLCDNDTLISLDSSELETSNTTEKNKPDVNNQRVLRQRHITTRNLYKCPNCEKVYNARRNLTRHVNSECGRKSRFACPFCAYKNYRRNEIKKHVKSKHITFWDEYEDMNLLHQVCSFES